MLMIAAVLGMIAMCMVLVAGVILGVVAGVVIAGFIACGLVTTSTLAGLATRRWSTGWWCFALQAGTLAGAALGAGGLLAWLTLWYPPIDAAAAPWLEVTLGGAAGGLVLAVILGFLCRWLAALLRARYNTYLANVTPM